MFEKLKEKYREEGRQEVLSELRESQRWFTRFPKVHNFIERFCTSFKLYGGLDNDRERDCVAEWDDKLIQ